MTPAITMTSEQIDTEIAALEERKAKLQRLITLRGEVSEFENNHWGVMDFEKCIRAANNICASKFHTTPSALLSRVRLEHVSDARQVSMYIVRELTGAPFVLIGEAFHRNHGTVMYACCAVRDRASVDRRFHHLLCTIRALVQEQLPKDEHTA